MEEAKLLTEKLNALCIENGITFAVILSDGSEDGRMFYGDPVRLLGLIEMLKFAVAERVRKPGRKGSFGTKPQLPHTSSDCEPAKPGLICPACYFPIPLSVEPVEHGFPS